MSSSDDDDARQFENMESHDLDGDYEGGQMIDGEGDVQVDGAEYDDGHGISAERSVVIHKEPFTLSLSKGAVRNCKETLRQAQGEGFFWGQEGVGGYALPLQPVL